MAELSPSGRPARRTGDAEARALASADQLAIDAEVVRLLRADGFVGQRFTRRYMKLVARLVDPTSATLWDWLDSNRIYTECRKVGRPVRRDYRLSMTYEDREDLVVETVAAGERLFLKVGWRGGGWKPEKGATLQTYFTGSGIREFPAVYRRWEKQKLDNGELLMDDRGADQWEHALAEIPSDEPGPERMAELTDQVDRVMALISDQALRRYVEYRRDGLTSETAASRAEVSTKAAETRLVTWRKRHVRPSEDGNGEYGKEVY